MDAAAAEKVRDFMVGTAVRRERNGQSLVQIMCTSYARAPEMSAKQTMRKAALRARRYSVYPIEV